VNKPIPLTVIFTTFNEEHNIGIALDTVLGWADEIIIVDSFSTDKTESIVRQYPEVLFMQHKYLGPAFQKNWAIPLAKHKWVLLMDADERVSTEMQVEITEILRGEGMSDVRSLMSDTTKPKALDHTSYIKHRTSDIACYWIGFTHYFMGKKVNYSGWQNDKTIRLIQRDKCRYNNNKVHEEIITEGLEVGQLRNKFAHYTFKNISHFVAKQERYAAWSAEDKEKTTGRITYYHLWLKPFFRFFKHFILKKGFLDGYVGFIISAVAAWSVFMRYVFMVENRKNTKI
jgi:glycosyltransferase involved in cell wall biosynthesis